METVPHSPSEDVYATTDDHVQAPEVHGASRLLFVARTRGLAPGASGPSGQRPRCLVHPRSPRA